MLIVDDAVVIRRLVSDVLGGVRTIEVVGTARNGRLALAKLPQLDPDLVILDVEMPEMDGIETLTALRELRPRLPVIMFSTLTEQGTAITLEALMRGANDYVPKPANVGSVSEAMDRVRSELVPRIHSLCGLDTTPPAADATIPRTRSQPVGSTGPRPVVPDRPAGAAPDQRVDAVVIGISTGGPSALAEIVPLLPADLAVPLLVVQHMPPMFTRLLAERLDRSTALAVAEAGGGESLGAGQCWIAPGDRHLKVGPARLAPPEDGSRASRRASHIEIEDGPSENSCRPSVDVLFRSAAHVYGPHLLGVVMTGMGQDGLKGSEAIVAAGGRVISQDEPTSVVWGMPGAVTRAGLSDAVLPLREVPAEIVRRVAAHRCESSPRMGTVR
ncbi:MAG: chemotaxis response regulator protein-glutamate methylesterase [Acidimicrobiales bacterium]